MESNLGSGLLVPQRVLPATCGRTPPDAGGMQLVNLHPMQKKLPLDLMDLTNQPEALE